MRIPLVFGSIINLVSSAFVSHVTTRKDGNRNIDGMYGSLEGGTLLWIVGNGFREIDIGLNPSDASPYLIQIINYYNNDEIYTCAIDRQRITSTKLACYTLPLPPTWYNVRVYMDGAMLNFNPNHVTFYPAPNHTPLISSISPTLGISQRLVRLMGDFKTNCYAQDREECLGDLVSRISRSDFVFQTH